MKLKPIKFTKKTFLILGAVVLVLAFGAYAFSMRARAENVHTNVSATALKKTDLQDTVAVSGTVHSDDSYNVYTTLTLPVKTVSVYVGDKVKKGDVLAVLDTENLEKDVEQQKYVAEGARKSAELALEQARTAYENAQYLYSHGLNNGIVTAETALKTAADAYNYNKLLYESGQISKSALDQSQSDYDKAQKSLTIAKNQAQQDLKSAKNAYDSAVAKAADKSAQAGLEKLQKNLADATIVAPADGVVTAKNVSVGSMPSGVMFVVENTGKLVVDAEVKEIDAASVKPGDPVTIRTDATGDTKIKGTVASIAPAATASTEGTGNVTYTAKISVEESNPSVRIGMKARLDIVVQEKKGVFVVPYDALIEKNGGNVVLAAEKSGALYKAKEIPVTTGLETDVAVEISGSGLSEGLPVIGSPDGISAGDTVQLASGAKK